jgi:hypothetical protein
MIGLGGRRRKRVGLRALIERPKWRKRSNGSLKSKSDS